MNDLDNRPEVERRKAGGEVERMTVRTANAELDLIVVVDDDQQYQVWTYLSGHDFVDGHIIGLGPTRDAAVGDAVELLEAAVETLQGPAPRQRPRRRG